MKKIYIILTILIILMSSFALADYYKQKTDYSGDTPCTYTNTHTLARVTNNYFHLNSNYNSPCEFKINRSDNSTYIVNEIENYGSSARVTDIDYNSNKDKFVVLSGDSSLTTDNHLSRLWGNGSLKKYISISDGLLNSNYDSLGYDIDTNYLLTKRSIYYEIYNNTLEFENSGLLSDFLLEEYFYYFDVEYINGEYVFFAVNHTVNTYINSSNKLTFNKTENINLSGLGTINSITYDDLTDTLFVDSSFNTTNEIITSYTTNQLGSIYLVDNQEDIKINYNDTYSNNLDNIFNNADVFGLKFTYNNTEYDLKQNKNNDYNFTDSSLNDYNKIYISLLENDNYVYLVVQSKYENLTINNMQLYANDTNNNTLYSNNFTLNVDNNNFYIGNSLNKIKDFDNIIMKYNTEQNFNLNDYFSNYDTVQLVVYCGDSTETNNYFLFANIYDNQTYTKYFDDNNSNFVDVYDNIALHDCPSYKMQLLISENDSINMRVNSYDKEYYNPVSFLLTVQNSKEGYNINGEQNFYLNISGSNGILGSVTDSFNSIFPDSDTINIKQKFAYVLLILLGTLILLVTVVFSLEDSGRKIAYFMGFIIMMLEVFYFVSIGYINVVLVIIMGLIAGFILFYLFNKSGVTS